MAMAPRFPANCVKFGCILYAELARDVLVELLYGICCLVELRGDVRDKLPHLLKRWL